MASEITVNVVLNCAKANGPTVNKPYTKQITLSGNHFSAGVQTVPTTAGGTAIPIGSAVATLGFAIFGSLDVTNYVEIGIVVAATFYPVVRLKAGEPAEFRLVPGVTYYARANTASVDLEFTVLED